MDSKSLIVGLLVGLLLGVAGAALLNQANAPVDLAGATDAATFERGIKVNSRLIGATPALVVNARGTQTAQPFEIQADSTVVASVNRSGRLTLSGGLVSTGFSAFPLATPVAVVHATTIAPGGSYQPISAAATAISPVTIPSAGRTVCLINTGSPVITIQDTGNQVLTGDAALGQYDTLCVYSDGTRIIEVSRANN